MKYFLKIILLIISYNLCANEIVISYAQSSSNYGKPPIKKQQIDIDKIKKIAKEKNINVKFKAVPWKRSLLMLEKGLLDGAMNASYKVAREKFAVYPISNGKVDRSKRLNDGNTYYIYRHIDSSLRWDGKKFINGGKVGVREKYAVIDDLKKHPNIEIEECVKNFELVRKLSSKVIEAYAGSAIETNVLIKKYDKFSKSIVKEPLPIRKKDYFLIFSKKAYSKNSKQMEAIWLGLKEYNERHNK